MLALEKQGRLEDALVIYNIALERVRRDDLYLGELETRREKLLGQDEFVDTGENPSWSLPANCVWSPFAFGSDSLRTDLQSMEEIDFGLASYVARHRLSTLTQLAPTQRSIIRQTTAENSSCTDVVIAFASMWRTTHSTPSHWLHTRIRGRCLYVQQLVVWIIISIKLY